MTKKNEINELWHSAQSLDNSSPNIIYNNNSPISFEQQDKRDRITCQINNVVSSKRNKKWSESSDVIIYYTLEKFVIESTPNRRDNYNRFSPILTYGIFPTEDNDEEVWSEDVAMQVENFAKTINRELSTEAKKKIKRALKEIKKKIHKRKVQELYLKCLTGYLMVGVIVFAIPLVIGAVIHQEIPNILTQQVQQIPRQNFQVLLPTVFQKTIQKLITLLSVLIAINNVLILMIAKLPIVKIVTRKFKDTNR